ncbi:hypothetical protein Mgra_00009091 [Meloidogyne graminicola]|nr:hypothetical protein Mgra_00009091 [Meloidogyne graminicola]
MNYIYIQ